MQGSRPRDVWARFRPPPLAWALLFGLLGLTVVGVGQLRQSSQRQVELERERRVAGLASRLLLTLRHHVSAVEAIADFRSASMRIDRDEFARFVAQPLKRGAHVQAFEWIPRVPAEERKAIERRAREGGLSGYRIRRWSYGAGFVAGETSWSTEYYPVFHVEPLRGNESAVGIDLGSHPTRRAALERARDTGRVVATEPIELAQATGAHAGILVFAPSYSRPGLETISERREHLLGFGLGVFRVEDLVRTSLPEAESRRSTVRLRDVTNGDFVLYSEPRFDELGAEAHRSRDLEVGGRRWVLDVHSPDTEVFRDQPLFLLGGVLVSLLAFGLVVSISDRHRRVEALVAERTAELEAATAVLEQAKCGLEKSNRELQQFARVASHDLKTPLRHVGSFSQLLAAELGDELGDDAQLYMDHVLGGVRRMEALIDGLLDLSRAQARHVAFEPVDLERCLDIVRGQLDPSLVESGTVTSGELPTVQGDAVQLMQLLINLVTNGLKYRSERPPRVHLSASRQAEQWQVVVEDNGIGVEHAHREQVFELFRRLHGPGEYPGSGIGLAICQRVVERHGGRIWVEGRPGGGSRFIFTLPVHESVEGVETDRELVGAGRES